MFFVCHFYINPCHSLFFSRDHLWSNMGIICGPGSFAVQFGDRLRSGIICGPGIICGLVQYSQGFENYCQISVSVKCRLQTADCRFIFLICFWWRRFGFYCMKFCQVVRIVRVIYVQLRVYTQGLSNVFKCVLHQISIVTATTMLGK